MRGPSLKARTTWLGRLRQALVGLALATTCALLQGCANPAMRADRLALAHGYQRLDLRGEGFHHVAYFKQGSRAGDNTRTLHVYIEHDGTPWSTPTTPSADPTPVRPLMLDALALDPAPALYLGRPCYFGTAAEPPCEPVWWTHRRFSAAVLASMQAALQDFLGKRPGFDSIHLFGYSGGGVLAALLAARVPNTRRLVTVAAPLDLDGWIRLHGYSPLEGSISPLDEPPLPTALEQLHLAGKTDDVVPGYLIRRFVDRQGAARFVEVPGFDHRCCWAKHWASLAVMR